MIPLPEVSSLLSQTTATRVINYHGSILKISEKNNDKTSLEFSADTFLAGGEETGFSCPDNMVFDKKGNLWFCSDISGSGMNQSPYSNFKNNGLFYVPMSGPEAGKAIRVASGPTDCELTGPAFSPDNSTLFLSRASSKSSTHQISSPR